MKVRRIEFLYTLIKWNMQTCFQNHPAVTILLKEVDTVVTIIEDFQVFAINTGFIFIKWYENICGDSDK